MNTLIYRLIDMPAAMIWTVGLVFAVALILAGKLWRHNYSPGDRVVYRKTKHSEHPCPRAENIHPFPHGEGYTYCVPKLWLVVDKVDEETLEVTTPGGKRHKVRTDDPHLHKAGPLERLLFRFKWHKSFPELAS